MLIRLLSAIPTLAMLIGLSEGRAQDEPAVVTLIKSKVKDPKAPFALFVEFRVKPGMEKEFEAAFKPCLAATRKEAGSVAYYLNRDTEHPEVYTMYEQFKNVDAIASHMKEKHTQTLLKTVGPMTEGNPTIKVLEVPK
jgi:quinol monooxygenase YgiN